MLHSRQAILRTDTGILVVTFNGWDYVVRELGRPEYTREQLADIKRSLDERFYLQK